MNINLKSGHASVHAENMSDTLRIEMCNCFENAKYLVSTLSQWFLNHIDPHPFEICVYSCSSFDIYWQIFIQEIKINHVLPIRFHRNKEMRETECIQVYVQIVVHKSTHLTDISP